jgi:hypothetical protein
MRKEVFTEVAVSSGGAPVILGGAPMEAPVELPVGDSAKGLG